MKLTWKTCLRAGVTIVLVYLACTYWPVLTGAVKVAMSAASPLLIGAALLLYAAGRKGEARTGRS